MGSELCIRDRSNMAGTIIAVKTAIGTNPKASASHGGGRLLMLLLSMIKRVAKVNRPVAIMMNQIMMLLLLDG